MNIADLMTPRQLEALELLCDPVTVVALYGGSRSGKTTVTMIYLLLLAINRPSRHVILRKHLSTLISSLWYDTLPKVLDLLAIPESAYRFRGDRYFLQFINGSEIWLSGLDHNKRSDKILGNEYTTIWINEASEFDSEIIPTLMSRLAQKSGIYNKLLLDFNPPETSHWTYTLITESKLNEAKISLNHLLMNPGDNLANLPQHYLQVLEGLPERQRKRFLEGMFVSPEEAIFNEGMIRWQEDLPIHFTKIVIGIDPAATNKSGSDETGIMVLGRYLDNYYKLEDLSLKGAPEHWALRAVDAFMRWQSKAKESVIVAEVNQGGDMVKSVIDKVSRTQGVEVNYLAVRTSVSKAYRAEEFSIMLATQKWYFYGSAKQHHFSKYLKQFLGYTSILEHQGSPDRIDAAIIAASELNLDKRSLLYFKA